jgi:hypothetical protein
MKNHLIFALLVILSAVTVTIAWRLGIRNEYLKNPVPPVLPQSCPALLADYRSLQWQLSSCQRNYSQNERALVECRALSHP